MKHRVYTCTRAPGVLWACLSQSANADRQLLGQCSSVDETLLAVDWSDIVRHSPQDAPAHAQTVVTSSFTKTLV